MKIVIKYDDPNDKRQMTLKLTLPRKWNEAHTIKIKDAFVTSFNKKYADDGNSLEIDHTHLVNSTDHALGDNDIVLDVLEHGDHLRVKPGPAPLNTVKHDTKSNRQNVASIPTPLNETTEAGGHVSSAAAIKAAATVTHPLDYSKWDRLDLSDDDGEDCHPNIDKASWKRLMGRKREDRRTKEDEKIAAYKNKIEKYTTKAKTVQCRIDSGDNDAQLLVDLHDAQDSAAKYNAKLDKFLATRKLTADDLCEVREDHTVVASSAEIKPIITNLDLEKKISDKNHPSIAPARPLEEGIEYDAYIRNYRGLASVYASLRSDEKSENFLLENPQLLHDHNEGYLLLRTLDTCMRHLDAKEEAGNKWTNKDEAKWRDDELAVARQHLLIQFVLTLSKGKRCDPRDMIKPFFRKTSKHYKDRVEGFKTDLDSFVERIRNRAAEKKKLGEPSPLSGPIHRENDDYEDAEVGPGGLHPNDVLSTLPVEMQDAFVAQDVEKLNSCLLSMTDEEANYHMKRCIDSGLWDAAPVEETE